MRRRSRIRGAMLVAMLVASATPNAQTGPAVRDARGVEVRLARPAARIAVLAPGLAEIAYSAGAGARVVGVSTYTDYPPEASRLPVVSSPGRVDLERLAVLAPDLVLAWESGNPPAALARIEARGTALYVAEPRTLAALAGLVRAVGVLAGTASEADRAAAAFEADLAATARGPAIRERAFIEIWPDPMLTVSGAHLVSDIVRHCGADNVFAESRVLTPRVGMEDLIAARPGLVITGVDARDAPAYARWKDRRRLVEAVAAGRVLHVDSAALHRQSLRAIESVRQVCDGLAAIGH